MKMTHFYFMQNFPMSQVSGYHYVAIIEW